MESTFRQEIQSAQAHTFKTGFQAGKVRFQVWLGNLSKPVRILVVGGSGLLALSLIALLGFGIYSFWLWNYKGAGPLGEGGGLRGFAEWAGSFGRAQDLGTGPKTEPSPINGVLYTVESAEVFMQRRPLAILVNNHVDARPQSGLSEADLIYEAVAEGGITRLLAIYHARDADKVGPVRSARIYYIDWAAEFYAWLAHWGGSFVPDYEKQLIGTGYTGPWECDPKASSYAYINEVSIASLDQMWLGDAAYYRDTSRGVATEHTGYTSTQKLWEVAPDYYPEPGWTEYFPFGTWLFKDDVDESSRPASQRVSFGFWDSQPGFDTVWDYNPADNTYLRNQGGQPVVDAETNQPIAAKTVIVQLTDESEFGDKKEHLKYATLQGGAAKIFMDGQEINATWSKPAVRERTRYYHIDTGGEVSFNRGQIWIEVVPTGNVVTVN